MAVSSEARGKGYGKVLMEEVIKSAKNKKGKKIFLVSNTRLKPAISLYIKYGFKTKRLVTDPDYDGGNIEMKLIF